MYISNNDIIIFEVDIINFFIEIRVNEKCVIRQKYPILKN